MFTGIVTDIGTIVRADHGPGGLRVRIATCYDSTSIDIGASIACDGVCLTVVAKGADDGHWFDMEASAETLGLTTLGEWREGRRINLERALRLGDELGGHLVSGHVDGTATVLSITDDGDSTRITFDAPPALSRFIAPKGSVALNGTSLTVNEVDGHTFGVNLIPHTKTVTNWGDAAVGAKINLEIDTLARYVARLNDVKT